MSKPWKSQPGGNQLEAYVGAFGIKTSLCESTEELILVAARLFDLEAMPTVQMMAEEITALGKKTPYIKSGKSATLKVTFKKKGSYEYICTVGEHAQRGMQGKIKVT